MANFGRVGRKGLLYALFWLVMLTLSLVFLLPAIGDLPSLVEALISGGRNSWLATHAALAMPILLIAPLQFAAPFRRRFPQWHRWLGRTFLSFAMIAALSAFILGWTYANPPARVPLALFGLIWLYCGGSAWALARAGDYAGHRRFAMRTFAIATAFIWIRVLGEFQHILLSFVEDESARGATREWLCFVLPLAATEAWLGWPGFRASLAKGRRKKASIAA